MHDLVLTIGRSDSRHRSQKAPESDMSQRVETIGQAISVLIQTANLAQSRGILTFDDAVIVKSAIDFVQDRIKESMAGQPNGQPHIEAEANTAEAN